MKIAAALQVLFFLTKLMDQLIGSKAIISIIWAGKKRKYLWISRIYKGGECKRYLQKNIFHKIIYLFLVWSFKVSPEINKQGKFLLHQKYEKMTFNSWKELRFWSPLNGESRSEGVLGSNASQNAKENDIHQNYLSSLLCMLKAIATLSQSPPILLPFLFQTPTLGINLKPKKQSMFCTNLVNDIGRPKVVCVFVVTYLKHKAPYKLIIKSGSQCISPWKTTQ